ncbi:MAG: ATP-binding protein [Bacillota bacterium]
MKFINRERELAFLESEFHREGSSLVIIYGRRRLGKTTLIKEFLRGKRAGFFLATEELENDNRASFRQIIADLTGNDLLRNSIASWEDIFKVISDSSPDEKLIVVIDEFQNLGKSNPAFPSIMQKVWDNLLINSNIMLILCGSLISMMESQTLNYTSPLYGRRTGQIKLKQIEYRFFHKFFEKKTNQELLDIYAVTGGVPKYAEMFPMRAGVDLFTTLRQAVLSPDAMLYDEPVFLLSQELTDSRTYFSILKALAAGNRKISSLATILEIKQTSLPKYLKTLIELDVLERRTPVTEVSPEKSKRGLYYFKDNFLEFWFKFVFPRKSDLEAGYVDDVENGIKQRFAENHVAFVFEEICRKYAQQLSACGKLPFKLAKVGAWWNNNAEIDIVGFDETRSAWLFGECKYTNEPVSERVLYALIDKCALQSICPDTAEKVYVLFAKTGFTKKLASLAKERKDVLLIALETMDFERAV